MPIKNVDQNKSLLTLRPKVAQRYSRKNNLPASQVFSTTSNLYWFDCMGCGNAYKASPKQLKGKYQLVYCNNNTCQDGKKDDIARLKMGELALKRGSLLTKHPEIAKTWLKVIDSSYSKYDPDTTTCDAIFEVLWQCNEYSYHQWPQNVGRRVRHPACPYCTGQRIHENDSAYSELKKSSLLGYLLESNIEKAKQLAPQSHESLEFICQNCSSPQYTNAHIYINSIGCKNCKGDLSAKKRTEISVTTNGSVADFPYLVTQYCYNQTGLPSDAINSIPPEEVPVNSTISVNWICQRNHISRAPVYSRFEGTICHKCSMQSSLLEVIVLHELLLIFGEDNVLFREKIEGKEADIIVQSEGEKFAIEVDGFHHHEKQQEKEENKNNIFKENGYTIVRIRDVRLSGVIGTNLNIKFEHDKVSMVAIKKEQYEHVVGIINTFLEKANKNKLTTLNNLDCALEFYFESRNVKLENSAGFLFPQLNKELDKTKTHISLYNLTKGASIPLPWCCLKCSHKWTTALSKRTSLKQPTGCPVCNGQAVNESNSLATKYPDVANALNVPKEGHNITVGSGKRLVFKCTYPQCQEIQIRAVKDMVSQFKRRNHCYRADCNHE